MASLIADVAGLTATCALRSATPEWERHRPLRLRAAQGLTWLACAVGCSAAGPLLLVIRMSDTAGRTHPGAAVGITAVIIGAAGVLVTLAGPIGGTLATVVLTVAVALGQQFAELTWPLGDISRGVSWWWVAAAIIAGALAQTAGAGAPLRRASRR